MSRYQFMRGAPYTREEVWKAISEAPPPDGGTWFTGYNSQGGADFIFCNVGSAGRTGHDYGNHFDGDDLIWSGNTRSHQSQPSIQRMTSPGSEVHVFWRAGDRQPFTYAGVGRALTITDGRPVKVRWRFGDAAPLYPDEVEAAAYPRAFVEGAVRNVTVNAYERNADARRECIRHYGAICQVCELEFSNLYGPLGEGFIHVHHKVRLADVGTSYVLDPIADLVPVCPNCHSMLHRTVPPLAVADLRKLLKR